MDQVIAIDGLPASPAMAAALAKIASCDASKAASTSRQARIDADPRIIARRTAKAALPAVTGAASMFRSITDGSSQRRAFLSRLIRARIELLDGFPHHARRLIREAARIRRQFYAVVSAGPEMVVLEQRTEARAAGAEPLTRAA